MLSRAEGFPLETTNKITATKAGRIDSHRWPVRWVCVGTSRMCGGTPAVLATLNLITGKKRAQVWKKLKKIVKAVELGNFGSLELELWNLWNFGT